MSKMALFGLMVLNVTFNNISVISWRSILLVDETEVPRENHRLVASHWQTLSHNVVHLALTEIRTHNISGDGHRGKPDDRNCNYGHPKMADVESGKNIVVD
jgi:hypothetical protein